MSAPITTPNSIPNLNSPNLSSPRIELPVITLDDTGKFLHNGKPVSVKLKRNWIIVGCSTISFEAAKKIMNEHEKAFSLDEEVIVL